MHTHVHMSAGDRGIQMHTCTSTHINIPTEATGAQVSGEGEAEQPYLAVETP